MMGRNTYSETLLKQLMGEAEETIQSLDKVTQRDLGVQLELLKEKFEEVEQIQDPYERSSQMKILEADFGKLRENAKAEEQDLANAMFGLNASLELLGEQFENILKPFPEDEAEIRQAQAKVDQAEMNVGLAGQKWDFLGRRERAIERAKADVEMAKQALADTGMAVKARVRKRLMQYTMEQSLQDFMYKVEKTAGILEARLAEIKKQIKIIAVAKADAFNTKEEAAKTQEKLDKDLDDLQAAYEREEETLNQMTSGSADRVGQEQKVSDMKIELEDLRGRRNTAFVLYQSKEKFHIALETHEKSMMKLRDNHMLWITALRSDTESRVVTFQSRLEAMKAMSDQDAAKQLDDFGAALDQSTIEYMASVGVASDKLRVEFLKAYPGRINKMYEVMAAQSEASAQVIKEMLPLYEQYKKRTGVDPFKDKDAA